MRTKSLIDRKNKDSAITKFEMPIFKEGCLQLQIPKTVGSLAGYDVCSFGDQLNVVIVHGSVIEFYFGKEHRRFYYGDRYIFSQVIFWGDKIVTFDANAKKLMGISRVGKVLFEIGLINENVTLLQAISNKVFLAAFKKDTITWIHSYELPSKKPKLTRAFTIDRTWLQDKILVDKRSALLLTCGDKCLYTTDFLSGKNVRKFTSDFLYEYSKLAFNNNYIAGKVWYYNDIEVFDRKFNNLLRYYTAPELGQNIENLMFIGDHLLVQTKNSLYAVHTPSAFSHFIKIKLSFDVERFEVMENKIVISTPQNDVFLCSFDNNKIINTVKIFGSGEAITILSVIVNENLLVVKTRNNKLWVFSSTGVKLFSEQIATDSNRVRSFIIAANHIAVSFEDHPQIYKIDLNTLTSTTLENGHEKSVRDFYYENGFMFSSSWDNTVKRWTWPDGRLISEYKSDDINKDAHTSCVAVTGTSIFSGAYWDTQNGVSHDSVTVFNSTTGRQLHRFVFQVSSSAMLVMPSLDGKFMFFAGGSEELLKVNAKTFICEKQWKVGGGIRYILPLQNGGLVCGNNAGHLLFLNDRNESDIQILDLESKSFVSSIDEHSDKLYCSCYNGYVYVVSLSSPRAVVGKIRCFPSGLENSWQVQTVNGVLWLSIGHSVRAFDLLNARFIFSIFFSHSGPVFVQEPHLKNETPYFFAENPEVCNEMITIRKNKNQIEFPDLNSSECLSLASRYCNHLIMRKLINSPTQIIATQQTLKLRSGDTGLPNLLTKRQIAAPLTPQKQ